MSTRNRALLYLAFCLILLAVSWQVWVEHWHYARTHDTASHTLIVPIVTLALIARRRLEIFSTVPETSWWAGLPVVAAGAVAWMLAPTQDVGGGSAAQALTVPVASLVTMAIGGFLLIFGTRAFRAGTFPLLFLFAMVPVPDALLGAAVTFLKAGSAEVVAGLFTLTRTPFYREGYVFDLPTVAIEIADECSGIRSSIALGITALVAGHAFLTRSWSRVLLLLLVLPIAIFKNGVRVTSLSLLATYVDPDFLTGQLHHEGGFVFFGMSLVLLMAVMHLLQKAETKQAALVPSQV